AAFEVAERGFVVWLFLEGFNAVHAAVNVYYAVALDIAKPGRRERRLDADKRNGMFFLRDTRRDRERAGETFLVAHRVVGVDERYRLGVVVPARDDVEREHDTVRRAAPPRLDQEGVIWQLRQ